MFFPVHLEMFHTVLVRLQGDLIVPQDPAMSEGAGFGFSSCCGASGPYPFHAGWEYELYCKREHPYASEAVDLLYDLWLNFFFSSEAFQAFLQASQVCLILIVLIQIEIEPELCGIFFVEAVQCFVDFLNSCDAPFSDLLFFSFCLGFQPAFHKRSVCFSVLLQ